MGVISPDTHQRTSVSSYRFIGAYTGGLLVLLGTKKLVSVLGGGSEQTGYQATMGLYAAIAVVLFVVTFYTTKERVKPSKQQETSFMKDLRDVVTNGPWLVLFLLGIFTLSYVSIRNGSIMYYFKYVVADSRELLGFDLATWFMVSGSLATIVGTALTAPVARRVGKKQLYLALMGLSGILTIAFYFTGPRDYLAMFSLQVAMNFFMGPTAALVFAMFADAADYAEWKNRRRSTGLVFAASAFAQKMGWTVGGATAMFLLGAFGYEANVVQTEEAVMGLKLLMSIIPAVGAVLAAVVIFLYKLDDKFMKQIEEELEARRREAGEQPAEA
jgi:GPH family glycoside/pentoside/hexuronide:cation symporter